MVFSKNTLIGLFLIFSTACTIVKPEDLTPEGKIAPDPLFGKSRDLVIMPLSIENNEQDDETAFFYTTIYSQFINYFSFLNQINSQLENVIILNEDKLRGYYSQKKEEETSLKDPKKSLIKVEKEPTHIISIDQRNEMVLKAITDNTHYWMQKTPEIEDQLKERYKIPATQAVHIVTERDATKKTIYKEKKFLIAQLTITASQSLVFTLYDSLSQKPLIVYQKHLLAFRDVSDKNLIQDYMKEYVKDIFNHLMDHQVVEVFFEKTENQNLSVFINSVQVNTPSILLQKGHHSVLVAKEQRIISRGNIYVDKTSKISLKKIEKNNQQVFIETNPSHAAIYLNEIFLGFSPIETFLPKGQNFIRVSLIGYNTLRKTVLIDPDQNNPLHLNFNFNMNTQEQYRLRMLVHNIKIATFFSGVISLAGFAYSFEQMTYYQEKKGSSAVTSLDQTRYNQFLQLTAGFAVTTGLCFIVAIVTQIYDYQLQDIGIGLDDDKQLGLQVHF